MSMLMPSYYVGYIPPIFIENKEDVDNWNSILERCEIEGEKRKEWIANQLLQIEKYVHARDLVTANELFSDIQYDLFTCEKIIEPEGFLISSW